MNKRALAIVLPVLLVGAVTFGIIWWDRGAPPGFRPPVVDVVPSALTYEHRGVRLRGTAHYGARLSQRQGDETWYLFPVLDQGDTQGRQVKVLLRTQTAPDPILSFEDLAVEGLARPPGDLVGPDVDRALARIGYELDPRVVLVVAFDD